MFKLQKLDKEFIETNIVLLLCKDQGYDNASIKSGKYKDIKSKILDKNPQALFSLYSAYSLNICRTFQWKVV